MGCIWIYLFNPPNNSVTVDTNMITTTGKVLELEGNIQSFTEESWLLIKEDMGISQHNISDAISVSEEHQLILMVFAG